MTTDRAAIADAAIELASHGWAVIPLHGKAPAIPKRAGGNGVLDATTDATQIERWWNGTYRGANVGARVPDALMVIDIDPRHDGDDRLAELEHANGPLPATLTVVSGRCDGGRHLYFWRPPGKLVSTELGEGIDLKTSTGYCVMPPSVHPDSGRRYTWQIRPPVEPPSWLVDLLRAPEPPPRLSQPRTFSSGGASIADDYSDNTSWHELLEPHGWRCLDPDGDTDGARWRHPKATSAVSATVRHGCLFVYSPNTPFDVTEASDPHGVTRFRALAILDHDGDLSAAGRSLRGDR